MILLTALGAAAESYLGWRPGLVVGLVAGLLLARFVPVPGAGCAVPPAASDPKSSERPTAEPPATEPPATEPPASDDPSA